MCGSGSRLGEHSLAHWFGLFSASVSCWGHEPEFLCTQISRSSCLNAEKSLEIISHYKMRLVSLETHKSEGKQGLGEEAQGILLKGVEAELALCTEGKRTLSENSKLTSS